MFHRAFSALREPGAFFAWLRAEPRHTAAAYTCLLLVAVLSSGIGAWILLEADLPQAQQMRSMLEEVDVSGAMILVAVVFVAPIVAGLTWVLTWCPIRIGAGSAERLWEVAAWSQLPQLVLVPTQALIVLELAPTPAATAFISLVGVAWSAWIVREGVRELSDGRAVRAALVHAAAWSIPTVLNLLATPRSAPSGTFV